MSRVSMLALTAVLSVSAAVIATPAASAAAPDTVAVAGEHNQTAANKALVTEFYEQVFIERNVSAIDTYVSADVYIQHSPFAADGRDAFRALVERLQPDRQTAIERVVAQDDLVLVHTHAQPRPDVPSTAIVDIFRVSDGKIVEHWDTSQTVPETTVSGNDMFSTLSGPSTPGSALMTTFNERTVRNYFTRLNHDQDLRAIDRFVSPSLYQHDPALANGSAAVKDANAARFAANPDEVVSEEMVIAEGDLVMVRYHYQADAADRGQAVTEIFRVQQGRIVEHWSAIQNVPATSANDNTMF